MIARHEAQLDKMDIWAKLAAPLPQGVVSWRQDGRPIQRDGKYFARFVCYVDANTVRERLDSVVPGEWDLTLELLPPLQVIDDGNEPAPCSFKARLQILGVIREDVGTGRDYKSAATDAFKRVAVRFGIAHELYAYEQNWVQVDGDGRYAKPLEDPQQAYDRRHAGAVGATGSTGRTTASRGVAATVADLPARRQRKASAPASAPLADVAEPDSPAAALAALDASLPACPKCGGRVWDNRATKRNPKAPDFKCRDRSCDGVIWPPRDGKAAPAPAPASSGPEPLVPEVEETETLRTGTDDLPF